MALALDIIGPIGEFDVSFESIRSQVKAAGPQEPIDVVINGPGGSLFEGFAIFAELDRHPAPVNVEIRGLAASAHSVVAMAADPGKISIHPLGRMMIHQARGEIFDVEQNVRKHADVLGSLDTGIRAAYAKHSSLKDDELRDAMNPFTWYNAAEAKGVGLVSAITSGSDAVARVDFSAADYDVPDDVRELYDKAPAVSVAAALLAYYRDHREPAAIPPVNADMLAAVNQRLIELRSQA